MTRLKQTFDKYKPPYITVWKKLSKTALRPIWGLLYHKSGKEGNGVVLIPQLNSVDALAFALHECAHFWLKHFDPEDADTDVKRDMYTGNHNLTRAQEEYEAEQWTIATLRREGYTVSDELMKKMKNYVAWCIKHDKSEGRHKHPQRVKRFAQ